MTITVGIVGAGKIANAQHLPAIHGNPAYNLVACCDPWNRIAGIDGYDDLNQMLTARPDIAAVSICTPPQVRHAAACVALNAGKHVLLEKPPCTTVAEARDIAERAAAQGVTVFAAWHSRFAQGVARARAWLETRPVASVDIIWREDVRVWHPGQDWIWRPGGLGVFDPGINALSILTHIVPGRLVVRDAEFVVPEGRDTPIAATLHLATQTDAPVSVDLDWRGVLSQAWDIAVSTQDGAALRLTEGGRRLWLDGERAADAADDEYAAMYRCFATLIEQGESHLDSEPLSLVADAFLLARHRSGPVFDGRTGA